MLSGGRRPLRWAHRLAIAVAVVVAGVAASAQVAGAAIWTPPIALSPTDPAVPGQLPSAAVGQDGRAIAVWFEQGDGSTGQIMARTLSPGGLASAPVAVSGPDAAVNFFNPPAAIDIGPGNVATVVWVETTAEDDVLMGRRIRTDGTLLSPPFQVSEPGTPGVLESPSIAIAPDGTASVAWMRHDAATTIEARQIRADGTLTPQTTINEETALSAPVVTAPTSSTANVVYLDDTPATTLLISARFSDGGSIDFRTVIASDPDLFEQPRAASDAQGTVNVVWLHELNPRIARVAPDGALIANAQLDGEPSLSPPDVATAPDGTATAIWIRGITDHTARVRRLSPNGTLGPNRNLQSGTVAYPAHPAIGAESGGTFSAAWMQESESGSPRLAARRIAPDGSFAGAAQPIGEPVPVFPPIGLGVAANGPGTSTISWFNEPDTGAGVTTVYASRFTETPSCSGQTVAVPHDTPVTVQLRCTGNVDTRAIVTGPAHGTLGPIAEPAGTVVYTPAPGFSGPDAFTFNASNAAGPSAPATVTLNVAAGPAPPAPPPPPPPGPPPPPPPPPPPATGSARTTIVNATARLHLGRIAIRLRCRTQRMARCRGVLRILPAGSATRGAGRRAIGRAPFSIRAGRTATVRVTAPRATRLAVRRRGRATVRAVAQTIQAAGRPRVTTRRITVSGQRAVRPPLTG